MFPVSRITHRLRPTSHPSTTRLLWTDDTVVGISLVRLPTRSIAESALSTRRVRALCRLTALKAYPPLCPPLGFPQASSFAPGFFSCSPPRPLGPFGMGDPP